MPRTLIRRLRVASGSERIESAIGVRRDRPGEPIEFRARAFVVAAGYLWSSHMLLLSAGLQHPAGLANRSGLVGEVPVRTPERAGVRGAADAIVPRHQ
ncbi:MAG: hypothetical protein U0163_09885 [Gemmatimonadaceae bacterium]